MKRIVFLTVLLCCSFYSAKAQNVFEKNGVVLSAGVGIGTAVDVGRTVVPPLSFQGEYGILDHLFDDRSALGVGGYIGFAGGRKTYASYGYNQFSQRINAVMIGARGTFHYQFVKNLDTYAGIMLGGTIANTRNEGVWTLGGVPPRHGGFLFDVFIGARYYIIPKLAVYGEFGFGVAYFNLGVAFRI